ncbi:MAG TPA: lysozyme inhibitor LprI family protein [Candidatus Angelobacter sp.]|nr:lysozyme inhibitor LprI family protein [Candidatus Angelobacter sp.]
MLEKKEYWRATMYLMNRIITLALLVFSIQIIGVRAVAQSSCDHPKNDFDGLYCLNKVWIEADKNMNEVYKKLALKLDTNGKAALKKGQLSWISSRNNACSKADPKEGFFVNLECATNTTIERTKFLEDRYRECVSAGCMNSKL